MRISFQLRLASFYPAGELVDPEDLKARKLAQELDARVWEEDK